MKTAALIAVLIISLVAATTANAARPTHGLHMGGPEMRPVLWTWAVQASANVPMPDARITVWTGDPQYLPIDNELYLPRPGHLGYTAHDVRGSFLHELGHVYDFANMTPARRNGFKLAVGTSCNWWAKHCKTVAWDVGPDIFVDVPPGEMFAETYAACALGLTQRGYQDAGFLTYGWVPSEGTDDATLCSLIRG